MNSKIRLKIEKDLLKYELSDYAGASSDLLLKMMNDCEQYKVNHVFAKQFGSLQLEQNEHLSQEFAVFDEEKAVSIAWVQDEKDSLESTLKKFKNDRVKLEVFQTDIEAIRWLLDQS